MIIISPWAKALLTNKPNPKSPPIIWWYELINLISEPIIQIGLEHEKQLVSDFRANLSIPQLCELLSECRTFVTIDSFFQHLAWDQNKPGIVIWGQSNPKIYGHDLHTNLLKDSQYLMKDQFLMWEMVDYREDCFITPKEVIVHLNRE